MEWANNILESINKFVMVDNDVKVFYKILYKKVTKNLDLSRIKSKTLLNNY